MGSKRLTRPALVLMALLAGATGLLCRPAQAAQSPRTALVDAARKTNSSSSARVSMLERVVIGGQTETVRLLGIEEPRSSDGSFVLDTTPAAAGLGQATEIELGAKIYVHYPILDTLHARNPSVRPWIVVDTNSSLGVGPTAFASLDVREVDELTRLHLAGTGVEDGVKVTRYEGTLDLAKSAQFKPLQQLLSHLPSGAAAVLGSGGSVEYSVGGDGLIRAVTLSLSTRLENAPLTLTITVTFTAFDRSVGPIIPPAPSQVMTVARFDQLLGVGPTPAETALLHKVVLAPSQVGAGYTLAQIPGGQLVQGETTLDFCDLSYASEALRSARLQVVYSQPSGAVTASNEVVTYNGAGAQEALHEVTQAAATCPGGVVKNPPSGVTDLVRRTRVVRDPRLLPDSVAVLETDTGTVRGRRVTTETMVVYQVRGDLLSGVYGNGRSAALVRSLTLHAAEASAGNLRRFVSSATPLAPGLTA